MIANEHVTAEIVSMRRRGLSAAPIGHPRRTPECPPIGALAAGRLTAGQQRHAADCPHCRVVLGGAGPRTYAASALGAIAAALVVGVLFSSWRQAEPTRFAAPAAEVAEPSPRAVEADFPAPLRLRAPAAPSLRLLAPPTTPKLPVIRPLERFQPPERGSAPVPVAALGGPGPPVLDPAPPPDVVGMLGLRAL